MNNDFDTILKIAKSMKRAIIHINTNYMLGTDLEYSTLSIIEYMSNIEKPFTAMAKDIITREAADKIAKENFPVYVAEYSPIYDMVYHSWDETIMYNRIMDLFRRVNYYISTFPLIYHMDALEKDSGFMSCAKTKVSDGLSNYIFDDKYLTTNFNKIHAINAKDKVSVSIYDIDSLSYLYEFDIDKKSHVVKEFIRYRKMVPYS